jgi:exopolysaccharide production repressor protein
MSLPVFLRSLILLLLTFAVSTYLVTGSIWTTFINTVICAILVQIGYVVCHFAVVRTPRAPKVETAAGKRGAVQGAAQDAAQEKQPAAKIARLPGSPSSPHA